MTEDQIILTVDIDTSKSKVTLMKMQEALKDQKKELKAIKDTSSDVWASKAKAVAKADVTVKELNKAINTQTKENQKLAKQAELVDKAMQGQLKTDREVNQALGALRQQRMDLNRDTTEGAERYEILTGKIQELSKEQVEANRSGKMYWDNVGNYQESVEKALDSTNKGFYAMRQEMMELRKVNLDNLDPHEILEVEQAMGQLQDAMDKTTARIKVQAMDDFPAVVASMQAVTSAVQVGVGAFSLLGASSEQAEKLQRVMVQLIGVSQALSQVQQLVASGEAAALAVKIKTIAVTKTATVVQWLYNKALTANPIGLIVAGVAGLITGILALTGRIKNIIGWFGKFGTGIRRVAQFLGISKKATEEQMEADRQAAAAKEAHRQKIEELRKSLEQITEANKIRNREIDREIKLLQSQGAEQEAIIKLQEEKLRNSVQEAKVAFQLYKHERQATLAMIERYELMGREIPSILKGVKDEYDEMNQTVLDLETDLKVHFNNETRRLAKTEQERANAAKNEAERAKEAAERRQQEAEQVVKREEIAQARLNLLIAKEGQERLQRQIELLEVEKKYKLQNTELTESERLIIIQEYQNAERDAIDAHNEGRRKLEEDFTNWKEGRNAEELDAIDKQYNAELERLHKYHDEKIISTEEFNAFIDELEAEREEKRLEIEREKEEKEKEEYYKWLGETKDRDLSEIEAMQAKLARFEQLRAKGLISQAQYTAAETALIKQIQDAYLQMQAVRTQAAIATTSAVITNLAKGTSAEAKAAKIAKGIAVAETGIDIVRTISQATALGPPQNIPMILMALAQTAGLVSQIRSISVPDAKMGGGGFVGGRPHSSGGTKYYGSDGNVVEFEKDEYLAVVNKRDSHRAAMLDGINKIHGGSIFANTGGYMESGGVVGFGETGEIGSEQELRVLDAIKAMQVVATVKDINAGLSREQNRMDIANI